MSDLKEITSATGTSTDVYIPAIGPLESRRARRERREAAESAGEWQEPLVGATEHEPSEIVPTSSSATFADELAVARQRKVTAIAEEVGMPGSNQDWGR